MAPFERVRVLSAEADSLTEIIRRAVSVYETLLTATIEEGGKIILQVDGKQRELITR